MGSGVTSAFFHISGNALLRIISFMSSVSCSAIYGVIILYIKVGICAIPPFLLFGSPLRMSVISFVSTNRSLKPFTFSFHDSMIRGLVYFSSLFIMVPIELK